jgi:hypothetical protein
LATEVWGWAGIEALVSLEPTHRQNTAGPQGQMKEGVGMSPTGVGRFTIAATRANLVGKSLRTPKDKKEDTPKPEDGISGRTLTMAPWPLRPVSPARVGPSRNAHPHLFNDPSNYLG